MADSNVVQGFDKPNTHSSDYNSLSFIIQQAIRGQVNTAIVCKVTAVSVNHVDVLPLVSQVDGFGEMVEPTTLYHLPFMRYHGGVCAVKVNPVVGDIGLAVFTQKDCSNVSVGQSEPQKPASNRTMSMANGFYIGGFLNTEPSCYIELKQDGSIDIAAPGGVNITGNVSVSGDVIVGGISVKNHVHGGVLAGGDDSGTPK
jgi:hypothetical protein